jgi:hypothetical protein
MMGTMMTRTSRRTSHISTAMRSPVIREVYVMKST